MLPKTTNNNFQKGAAKTDQNYKFSNKFSNLESRRSNVRNLYSLNFLAKSSMMKVLFLIATVLGTSKLVG